MYMLDVDLLIFVIFHIASSREIGFLQLTGVIAAIVVVSTLDASATSAVPIVKVI